jgi:nucleoside recognition membrane protein YjiH
MVVDDLGRNTALWFVTCRLILVYTFFVAIKSDENPAAKENTGQSRP